MQMQISEVYSLHLKKNVLFFPVPNLTYTKSDTECSYFFETVIKPKVTQTLFIK